MLHRWGMCALLGITTLEPIILQLKLIINNRKASVGYVGTYMLRLSISKWSSTVENENKINPEWVGKWINLDLCKRQKLRAYHTKQVSICKLENIPENEMCQIF